MVTPARPLRVLLIEDSDDDAELVKVALRQGGYEPMVERVTTEAGMRDALGRGPWDVVLSDYTLPTFSAMGALAVLQGATNGDVPLVIVSASVGEAGAVEALKAGAGDIVAKGNLTRLVPAIERELRDHQIRKERRDALEALTQAVHMRDEFLSIASHELKTPLTSLQLQVQSLSRALEGIGSGAPLDKDRAARTAKLITRQSERLTELINRLLDFSRISRGRLELNIERTDLARLAREAVDRMEDVARDAGSALKLEDSPPMFGDWDPQRIDAVITNLLTNAVKYGGGKPIDVALADLGAEVRFTVRDAGIGIAPADQERIFGRFERAVSFKNYGGFGVGLWIARQIVEEHGGRIDVASSPGGGATFAVVLPKERRASP